MLTCGQGMYLLIPNPSNKKLLAPGKVIAADAMSFTIELEDPASLQPGTETLAYCDVRGKFFQQGTTLVEIKPGLPNASYFFNRVGEPVSAESRQTFRVSVALSEVVAQVGSKRKCHVVDLSPEGMAFVSDAGLELGSVVKVSLAHEEFKFEADARVQTIKVLPGTRVRYGLLVPNTNSTARKTLLKMSMGFQRTQLKRLAGAA